MGTKKKDKEHLWLEVFHFIEDAEKETYKDLHKLLRELNSKFFIKERKSPTHDSNTTRH